MQKTTAGALDGVAQDILRFQRPTEFSAFIPLPFGTSIEDTTSANIQWIADMRAKMTQMSRRVFYAQGKPTELESDTGLLLKLILWLYKVSHVPLATNSDCERGSARKGFILTYPILRLSKIHHQSSTYQRSYDMRVYTPSSGSRYLPPNDP